MALETVDVPRGVQSDKVVAVDDRTVTSGAADPAACFRLDGDVIVVVVVAAAAVAVMAAQGDDVILYRGDDVVAAAVMMMQRRVACGYDVILFRLLCLRRC